MNENSGTLENAKTERVNGILKTEMLKKYLEPVNKAQEAVAVAISKNNHLRQQSSIGNLIPFKAHSLKSR